LPWSKKIITDSIRVREAAEHNLKSVSLDIPRNSLTVVTGVSGSGKSSLVFDTLYREAERRYLESFSSHARQFLGKLTRPAVGSIDGLSPAIAVDQKRVVRNPRSTVGTLSELYDHLRLFFARLGSSIGTHRAQPPTRSLFSFNNPEGACPVCNGLGVQDRVDQDLLIADPGKTLRGGALVITTPNGYIIYSQVTMDVLNQVCNAHGFSTDIPWRELSPEQQHIVLYGSDIIKIPYGKHPLESRLKWSGITAKPREEGVYKGIIPVIENILKVDRNKNILRFVRSVSCEACGGTRLKPEALAVTLDGFNIAQMAAMSVADLHCYFEQKRADSVQAAVLEPLRRAVLERTSLLQNLGLGYLTLDRESTTLSGGEAQRIRLALQIGTGLSGILYTLDEPSIGLHHRDNLRLLEMLRQLRDQGNTVVMVEHDEDTMRQADFLVDIGPGAGSGGGEILFAGSLQDLEEKIAVTDSRTLAFLTGAEEIPLPAKRRDGTGLLTVKGATRHNLKGIDVSFRLGAVNLVTGVSGAGKSTLVHHTLALNLKTAVGTRAGTRQELSGTRQETIIGWEALDKVIEIDQTPIGRTPRSNPATYTKLFDLIRDLFAELPESKERQWPKGRFSFNVKGGRCESCEGAGRQLIGMHFLGDVEIMCDDCGGKRFNDETLAVRYRGKNIYDILEMSVREALLFFDTQPGIKRHLDTMDQLGLGYITLGQSAVTLSGGEAQRVKLASELNKPATGRTLYILDEPSTGLHAADIKILLAALDRLVQKGNTVIIVEHHQDFIKTADWVIDLGPESGDNGGQVIAAGPPETIAQTPGSHTGAMLRHIFRTGGVPVPAPAPNHIPFPNKRNKRRNKRGQAKNSDNSNNINNYCTLEGVATHNLKNIDVAIPLNQLTVITGVSGSGKSSLAFDTLYAEGRRRFMSRFSTYARSFLTDSTGTDNVLTACRGMRPVVAVNRKSASRNPRSTVGTMTEIMDFYRLLFARAGQRHCPDCGVLLEQSLCPQCGFIGKQTLFATMFSFNHQSGACPLCNGLGTVTVCDPEKLVSRSDLSLYNGALSGSKTGRFYGDPDGRYIASLHAVQAETGIDFSRPWRELSEQEQQIAMLGTGYKVYDVNWQFKRKSREGEHRFQSTWQGFAAYVDEEYQRKHADKRGEAMLPLMTDRPCGRCGGTRLKKEFLAVRFAGINIAQLCALTVSHSIRFFRDNAESLITEQQEIITRQLRQEILRRLQFLQDVGLPYISPDRNSLTLSGGEAQRIRLAGQLGAGLTGVIYVLDEPTIGLHSRDTQRLILVMKQLRDTGNTLVVVEHDAEIIAAADHIIDMGPGAGRAGGEITAQGDVAAIMADPRSKTGRFLADPSLLKNTNPKRAPGNGLFIKGAFANNLKRIDITVPSGGITVLTGVSGSGKSTLMFDVVAQSAARQKACGCISVSGLENFDNIVVMDQQHAGDGTGSTPATYTGIFDNIRDMFAQSETARARNYKKNHFSFNLKGGRCETCKGSGEIRTSMDFLSDVSTLCERCGGLRYDEETLACKVNGKSIADVLNMTAAEALLFSKDLPKMNDVRRRLQILAEVGLGYLQLGQDALSSGERQRLKLAVRLIKGKGDRDLYLLDEPTTGLHFEDVQRLLQLFHRLADAGHTLLVIEHHPAVIDNADHIIQLGPEGGDDGGYLV